MAVVRKRLGDLLIEKGIITPEHLEEALKLQKKKKIKIGEALIELKAITEEGMIKFVGEQWNIPYIQLENYMIDPEIVKIIPEDKARQYKVIALYKTESNNSLTVAMSDPLDMYAIDDLTQITGLQIEVTISTSREIEKAIDQYYGTQKNLKEIYKSISAEHSALEQQGVKQNVEQVEEKLAEDMPIIRMVNLIITNAIETNASDIHIEPEENNLRIRNRIDGILYDQPAPDPKLQGAIISRIKVMAKLNIAERRIPQDGRFKIDVEGKAIDVRVSTFPTIYGENIVMRILDKSKLVVQMDDLGLSSKDLNRFLSVLNKPNGIILVTGPTGSGKTTTLYTALNYLNKPDKNIITLEDPVEYRLPGIRQTQILPEAGFTFATGLRAILRQDPDIIMVGEIRDTETAEIAIQASLTGHLVLSSMHTNDAPSTIVRLNNMGIEHFLVAASVSGVLAQRLIRKICPECKEEYRPSDEIFRALDLDPERMRNLKFYRGRGCNNCKNTGYKGRAAIFELMTINDKMKDMIISGVSLSLIKKEAQAIGMMSLREDGLIKATKGITTLEEVIRITQSV